MYIHAYIYVCMYIHKHVYMCICLSNTYIICVSTRGAKYMNNTLCYGIFGVDTTASILYYVYIISILMLNNTNL